MGREMKEDILRFDPKIERKLYKNPKKLPRTRISCRCCDEKLDIYFGEGATEINGVMASNDFWRKLFSQLPK